MTYTVRAQGRLQTPEEFGRIVVRATPGGAVVRLADVARDRARRRQLPADRPRQRRAGLRDRHLPGARLERAASRRRASSGDDGRSATRFPPDLQYAYALDSTLAVSEGIREMVWTLVEAMLLVVARRLPVPAELARDADSDGRRAGIAHRHVRGVPAARLLGQHAVALRPDPRHRPRRRRRDRRRRGGRAPHRARHVAA